MTYKKGQCIEIGFQEQSYYFHIDIENINDFDLDLLFPHDEISYVEVVEGIDWSYNNPISSLYT